MDDMSNLYSRYLEDIALIDKAGYIEKALQSSWVCGNWKPGFVLVEKQLAGKLWV